MENKEFYMIGYRHALDNAKSLMEIANSAMNLNNFGVATSLCILSAEESIKAIFILQQSKNPNSKVSDFDKIFRNHRIKHEYLEEFIKEIDRFRIESLNSYHSYLPDRKSKRSFARKNPKFQETIDWSEKHYKSLPEMLDMFDWLKKANDEKNKGLYVDIKNNEWQFPKNTNISLFNKAYKNASEIYIYVELSEKILYWKTHF